MSVVHRALFTWFALLVFLILVVLRVDHRTQWNWFVVFIPVWIFNAIILLYTSFDFVAVYNNGHSPHYHVPKDFYVLILILLKLCFEVMLCLKLEKPNLRLSLFQILSPLWVVLPVVVVHIYMNLSKKETP